MKDILINYPIKFLQQELINVRTDYRLEKKRIIEILKTMKSIKKLEKEQIIDLLIKYNYDISKLPKLEDLEKPKKPRAKPKEKIEDKIEDKINFKELCRKYLYLEDKKIIEEEFNKDFKMFKEQDEYKKLIENIKIIDDEINILNEKLKKRMKKEIRESIKSDISYKRSSIVELYNNYYEYLKKNVCLKFAQVYRLIELKIS